VPGFRVIGFADEKQREWLLLQAADWGTLNTLLAPAATEGAEFTLCGPAKALSSPTEMHLFTANTSARLLVTYAFRDAIPTCDTYF
jgi:hypothetical protein